MFSRSLLPTYNVENLDLPVGVAGVIEKSAFTVAHHPVEGMRQVYRADRGRVGRPGGKVTMRLVPSSLYGVDPVWTQMGLGFQNGDTGIPVRANGVLALERLSVSEKVQDGDSLATAESPASIHLCSAHSMGGKSRERVSSLEVYAVSSRVRMNRQEIMTGHLGYSWMKSDLRQEV